MKKRALALCMAAVMALTLVGCSGSSGQNTQTTAAAQTTVAAQTQAAVETKAPETTAPAEETTVPAAQESGEKTLRIAMISTPETLGMLRSDGYGTTVTQNMSDSLVRVNKDLGLEPGLATSWEWLDENTWQFKIREGVQFTNGNMLDAECVAYNLNSLTDRELSYRYSSHWGKAWPIEAEAVDEYTVNIKTNEPSAFVPNLLTRIVIYDDDQWIEEGDDEYFTHPAGTGPYEVDSWDIGIQIVLKKAETPYWDGTDAYFDKVIIDGVSSDASRLAGLQSGEYDMIDVVPYDQVERLKAEGAGKFNITTYDSVGLNWMYFNGYNENSWIREPKFREAVAHAIDGKAISEVLFGNICEVEGYVAPANTIGGDEGYSTPYEYDPEKTAQLLEEIGYDGSEVSFLCNEGEFSNDIATAEFITASLNAAGINCKLEQLEDSVKDEKRKGGEGDFDMINTPGSFGGISSYYWSQMSSKRGYDKLPEFAPVADLFEEAQAYGLDDAEREAKLREANEELWKLVPVAFAVESNLTLGTKEGLKNAYCIPNSWEIFKNAYFE